MRLRKNQIIASLKKEILEAKEYIEIATEYSLKEYFAGKKFAYEKSFEILYPTEAWEFYREIYKTTD